MLQFVNLYIFRIKHAPRGNILSQYNYNYRDIKAFKSAAPASEALFKGREGAWCKWQWGSYRRGLAGLEVEEYPAEKGSEVTVTEMFDEVGKDLGHLRKVCLIESIYMHGIKTVTNEKCVEIKADWVLIEKDGSRQEIKYDFVVVSIGAKSRGYKNIEAYCTASEIPCKSGKENLGLD